MGQSGSMQTPAAVTTNFNYPTPPRLWRTSPHRRRLRSVPLRYRFQDTNFIPFSWSLCPPGFRPHMSEISGQAPRQYSQPWHSCPQQFAVNFATASFLFPSGYTRRISPTRTNFICAPILRILLRCLQLEVIPVR